MAGVLDTVYSTLMKRNSVYMVFIFGGAILGERVVNSAFNTAWESNNKGKLFKDMKIPDPEPEEEE
eukprot:CAMPEP_0206148808 /NCGR_PEP_ID=MMETSP1473-20131121/37446_1 /ASSEMBLY_ACC=CAM_ASM_001109 /TAXON_ID=1461547 /ORGANISM="Stichococcus sp, Strain RCC1054" /LENGTH=65 /DNA_ID=CAMNT_0053546231 /DNA_START=565 /DNA_END=762 /DNA_ORIENTATION=-